MQNNKVSVFIPNSFLAETKDLKLKTSKVGLIGRALALFEVDEVVVYKDLSIPDSEQTEDGDFIAEILKYMDTPQYLRKKAIPIKPELRHVGILPPLRVPHHPVGQPELGDYRQGYTVKRNKKGTFVDIGMDKLAFCKEQLTVNKIFSFKITKFNPDFVVETTKYADTIDTIFDELKSKVESSNHIAIVFGGPYSSISENVESSKWETIKLNTIPNQGTETVRTEEAVISTLAIFNIL